jgi:hypothetical protein
VQSHFNQNESTESFLGVAEKYMTPGMDTPEPNGSYLIKANLTQSEVSPNFAALAPIYADQEGKIALVGRVRMLGSSSLSDLKLRVPKKPKRVLIKANYDVLSRK